MSLQFNDLIKDSSKAIDIKTFKEFLKTTIDKLGIPDDIKDKILAEFNKYDDTTYFELININRRDLVTKMIELIATDDKIQGILVDPELRSIINSGSVKKNWDKTMSSLARLQGLILLKKVTKNCEGGIEKIIEAMNDKLSAVNNILEAELTT